MDTKRLTSHLIKKTLLAILLLSALAGVAGSQLAPKVPLLTVLAYSALGVLLIGALVLAPAMASPDKKSFALRIDPVLWAQIERLAAAELRSASASASAQVEYLLREAVRTRIGGQNPQVTPRDGDSFIDCPIKAHSLGQPPSCSHV